MITLGQHKIDNNNRIIQLTDVFVKCLVKMGPAISDYNKQFRQIIVINLPKKFIK